MRSSLKTHQHYSKTLISSKNKKSPIIKSQSKDDTEDENNCISKIAVGVIFGLTILLIKLKI